MPQRAIPAQIERSNTFDGLVQSVSKINQSTIGRPLDSVLRFLQMTRLRRASEELKDMIQKIFLGCLLLSVATLASAATIKWSFSEANVDLGNTHSFDSSPSGAIIIASGFLSNGTVGHLYGKNLGGGEMGLGLVADPSGEYEIFAGRDFVQLDLMNILAAGINGLQITMNSTTDGEGWKIFNTSVAGMIPGGAPLLSGSDEAGHSISPALRYLDVQATGEASNMLLSQVTGQPSNVPEPSSLGMALLGIVAIGTRVRKSNMRLGPHLG